MDPISLSMPANLVVDADLLRKYGGAGPRYTSYPTADRFVDAFDADAYRRSLRNRSLGGRLRSLSLYVHHPFCEAVCYYCACNKIASRHRDRADPYLRRLLVEMRLVAVAGLKGEIGPGQVAPGGVRGHHPLESQDAFEPLGRQAGRVPEQGDEAPVAVAAGVDQIADRGAVSELK